MILFLSALFLVIIGAVLWVLGNRSEKDACTGIGIGLVIIFGIALFFMTIAVSIAPMDARATMARYEAFQETLDIARESANLPLELAALQQKAAEYNANLASTQYWAKNKLTSWFYGRKVLEIKFIR